MTALFLAWQDPESRLWFPIGRLAQRDGQYEFSYTRGAQAARKESRFEPLAAFPRMDRAYVSNELFPLFTNRFPPKSRSDYRDYLEWLNMPENDEDPLTILAHSGGKRATDTLEVFPAPIEKDGTFTLNFFAHGVRYLPDASLQRIGALHPGDRLLLVHDLQNPVDKLALMLRTHNPEDGADKHIVGYLPRYLLEDVFAVLKDDPQAATLSVVKVNRSPAPVQLRLLCQMKGRWPLAHPPFSGELYQPISVASTAL